MTQKVIKVGSSMAVTIPKEMADELGITLGQAVQLEIDKKRRAFTYVTQRSAKPNRELIEWTDKFIERYRPMLEALAKK